MLFPKALTALLLIGSISAQRFSFKKPEPEDIEEDFRHDFEHPRYRQNKFPEFPEVEFPEIPEIEFPEIPEIEFPEIPEIVFPEIPEIEFPEIPEIEFPEFPEIEFPEIPEIEFPEIPEIEFPEIEEELGEIGDSIGEIIDEITDGIDSGLEDIEDIIGEIGEEIGGEDGLGEWFKPPPCNSTVETVKDLDFVTFSASKWYVHMQTEQPYKPVDTNFCVTWDYSSVDETAQEYTIELKENLQLEDGKKFQNKLCAYEQESASKLAAGPCEFPKFFAQPHWVIAYDEDLGYALVSSGQQAEEGEEEGCFSTSEEFAGLWVLTRSPVRDDSLIEGILLLAQEQGFDTSVLNDVDHSDCGEEEECKDHEGPFGDLGPFWRRNKDCGWVAKRTKRRCFIVGNLCPETCDLC